MLPKLILWSQWRVWLLRKLWYRYCVVGRGNPTKGRQLVNLFKLALKFSDFIDSFDRPIIFILVITTWVLDHDQFTKLIQLNTIPVWRWSFSGRKFSENCEFCFKDGTCKRRQSLNKFFHVSIETRWRKIGL